MDGRDNLDGVVLRGAVSLWRTATATYARRVIMGLGVVVCGSPPAVGFSWVAPAFPWLFLMLALEGRLKSTGLSEQVLLGLVGGMTVMILALAALHRLSFKMVLLWFLLNMILSWVTVATFNGE